MRWYSSARSSYGGATVISNGMVRLIPALAPVPGMTYWLDASDLASLTKGGDNKVSQWSDRSGNSRHFAQATATLQPLYVPDALGGKPAVRFDGADDQLVFGSVDHPANRVHREQGHHRGRTRRHLGPEPGATRAFA